MTARGAAAYAALLATLQAPGAFADPVRYRIDPGATRIEFSVQHLGVLRAQGRFTQAAGTVVYDAAAQGGRIELDVAGTSVTTGWTLRDAFVRGETMFDVERHPVVRFRSTQLVFRDGRLARVDGELTLRGVTRPLSFAVSGVDCAGEGRAARCVAEVDGSLRRRDFGMDFAWPLIGDEVELHFGIVAVREEAVTAAAP
ncbi:MAG: YceI family protein [Burkholderiales bacterium]